MIENATPDQLGRVLEALSTPAICAKPDGGRQHRGREAHQTGMKVRGSPAKRQGGAGEYAGPEPK